MLPRKDWQERWFSFGFHGGGNKSSNFVIGRRPNYTEDEFVAQSHVIWFLPNLSTVLQNLLTDMKTTRSNAKLACR